MTQMARKIQEILYRNVYLFVKRGHELPANFQIVFQDEAHNKNKLIEIITGLEENLVWAPAQGINLEIEACLKYFITPRGLRPRGV